LQRAQTPQGFRLQTIAAAYRLALQDPAFASTDDCGIVVKYLPDDKVFVVRGEESNMKLTYKEDIGLLDTLFRLTIS
jgi:2-C-methyl-D-erythritol 4-phosphate cytidylyltransferase